MMKNIFTAFLLAIAQISSAQNAFEFRKPSDNTVLGVYQNDGDFGIGITAPTERLHVGGALKLETTSGSHPGAAIYKDATQMVFTAGGSNGYVFNDNTDTANLVRITNDGSLAVGTTSPAFGVGTGIEVRNATRSNLRLSLSATDGYESFYNGSGDYFIADNYGPVSGAVVFRNIATRSESMRISSAGKVGIGTASPSALLHIQDDDVSGTTKDILNLGGVTNTHKYTLKHIGSGTVGADEMALTALSGDNIMTWGADGNVGIRTTTPTSLFQIGGGTFAVTSDGFILARGGAVSDSSLSGCGTGATVAAGSGNSSGRVLIGTGGSVACQLTFNGTWPSGLSPSCIVQNETALTLMRAVASSTIVTFYGTTISASDNLIYHCFGR